MATENSHYDPLRNPEVDYERSDLSAMGILGFLIGLFVVGVFIELVIWGMFRFMAHSDVLFPQPKMNPMAAVGKAPPEKTESVLQNTPKVNLEVFPLPRLQTNDAGEMKQYVDAEQTLLNPPQPFTDPSGAVHISIDQAMKLIAERGLPVRPNKPPSVTEVEDGMESPGPAAQMSAPAEKKAAGGSQPQ